MDALYTFDQLILPQRRQTMFPFWLILGVVTILGGIFNRQILERLGSKPNSEVFQDPNRKRSSKTIEQLGRWLVVTLGMSFLVLGLGETVPANISSGILFALLGAAGLMVLVMIGITVANWKTR
jgi:hypothetical protein